MALAVWTLIGVAQAQEPHARFSLWADISVTSCEVLPGYPYVPFNVYVFLEPPADGVISAEFRLAIPTGHFSSLIVPSPVVSDSTTGVWYGIPGIEVEFTNCQTDDWLLIVEYLMVSRNTTPAGYWLYPHKDTQFMGITTCTDPSQRISATLYTCLTFNDSCWNCEDYYIDPTDPTATNETTWGAIKALHK